MKQAAYFGVDLGGSHVGIVLVDREGNIIAKDATNVEFSKYSDEKANNGLSEKEGILTETLAQLITNCEYDKDKYGVISIGIGVPGVFIGTKILRLVNIGIYDFDLGIELKKRFQQMGLNPETEVHMINDAAAAAIFEVTAINGQLKGAAKGCFYGLGTGLGTSLIQNGVVNPCEGGHVTVNMHAVALEEQCGCGSYGCAEVYTSVRTLRRNVTTLLGLKVSDDKETDETIDGIDLEVAIEIAYGQPLSTYLTKQLESGENKTANIRALVNQDNKNQVIKLYEDWIKVIIIVCRSNVNLCGTDIFVLGGSGAFIIRDEDLNKIRETVNSTNNLYRGKSEVTIVKTNNPNGAGAIGAALLPVYNEQTS